MNHIRIPIRGMHCSSCEILISKQLKKLNGVSYVNVNRKDAMADIQYSEKRPSDEDIAKAVQSAGYEVGEGKKLPWISGEVNDYKDLARAGLILYFAYYAAKWFGIFDVAVNAENKGLTVALLVGLVAGISTCMALVGGLVLSLSARHSELHPEASTIQKFRPHIYFNIGRVLGYAILGGAIGLLGKAFSPSTNLLGLMTIAVGGVMIFLGLKLIEIFPVLRDKTIALPAGIARAFGLHKEVKEYSHKSSMIMGALTFFLPCGFTQAMQIYAVSTGSFTQGMAIMGLFALGTAPGLLGVGGLTSVVKGRKARIFFMSAGLAVVILGWYNITNGRRLYSGKNSANSYNSSNISTESAQIIRMTQNERGYAPNVLRVKLGRPVKWIINSTSQYTCAASIVVPQYGISKILRRGENIITFTPTDVGEIPFSCSMGMYRGKFIVTN